MDLILIALITCGFLTLIGWITLLTTRLTLVEQDYRSMFDSIIALTIELKDQESMMDEVNYYSNLHHSEYLDHLYKAHHLVEKNGQWMPVRPFWTPEEEFEIRKFIQTVKEEGIKRGIIKDNSDFEDQS